MARRKIQEYTSLKTMREAKVYRDSEWNEYIVEHYREGIKQEGASYHTSDKQEALDHGANWTSGIIN